MKNARVTPIHKRRTLFSKNTIDECITHSLKDFRESPGGPIGWLLFHWLSKLKISLMITPSIAVLPHPCVSHGACRISRHAHHVRILGRQIGVLIWSSRSWCVFEAEGIINNICVLTICWAIKGKGSFYIAQYPVRWTAQSALHFLPSLADLFIPTPFSASPGSILAMQQLRATTKSLTFPPLSIARYSFIQLSQQGRQWREGKCPIFQTVAKEDSNPGSLDCESGILETPMVKVGYWSVPSQRNHHAMLVIQGQCRLAFE